MTSDFIDTTDMNRNINTAFYYEQQDLVMLSTPSGNSVSIPLDLLTNYSNSEAAVNPSHHT